MYNLLEVSPVGVDQMRVLVVMCPRVAVGVVGAGAVTLVVTLAVAVVLARILLLLSAHPGRIDRCIIT